MKLREKIKNWLFKEELEDLKIAKELYETAKNIERQAKHTYNKAAKEHLDSIQLVDSILDIGVDMSLPNSQEYSWAVVCIKGHPEYVRFINLTGQDASQVLQFLKHFEQSNVTVDSPVHFRHMFEDRFIKNPFKE